MIHLQCQRAAMPWRPDVSPYNDGSRVARFVPPRENTMQAGELASFYEAALPYDRYVATGTPEQQRRWQQVYAAAALTPDQQALVGGFVRDMKVLVVSGIWCGDCVQ